MLDKSDYGRSIQENINAVVADGKFNQAVDSGTLDQKNKGVFESPILLSVTSKDAKKIDIQNPVIGNLLSQVNMNKISDAKVKQLLGQAKDDEMQARLNKLRKRIDKNGDNNNNTNSDDSDVDDDDEDDNDSGDELRWRYNNLRQPTTIPNDNDQEELLRRCNNLKAPPNSKEELLRR